MIKTIELSKTYKGRVYALKSLNLEIEKGEIFGFLGPNGAGKSTTIKLILDIIRPTSGKALLFDIDVSNPESRKKVGYLPENPSFYDYLTAEELLWFAGRVYNMDESGIKKRTGELLELLDLTKAKSTPIRKYSKGMVQRAGLAHALINDPDLLILDEPTSGLDPVGRRKVADLLLDLKKQGKTIFFSSHILHDVETICDRAGIIVEGELRFSGKLSTVLHQSFQDFEVVVQNISDEILNEIKDKNIDCHKEGDTARLRIKEDDLWEVIEFIRSKNLSLFAIEPKRKTLEGLFLELINKPPLTHPSAGSILQIEP
ncbi:MAG: ABC transporter ATP-binding protein [Nitrospinae bacterium]|nr:ABC transporter ATP-binding protein [Nitrospinota bacterium]